MRLLNFAVKILLVSRNLGANNTRDQSRKISSTMHDKETDQRTAAQLSDCQRRVLSRSFKKFRRVCMAGALALTAVRGIGFAQWNADTCQSFARSRIALAFFSYRRRYGQT